MDCQRIDVAGRPPLYSCCLASAGFLGEVLHASEKMRWAGPARYDIAGGPPGSHPVDAPLPLCLMP